MLQQTQVATVIPFWERWMKQLPDISSLAAAPEEKVLKLWEGLGYYRRARLLHQAATVIMREHAGHFPEDDAAILQLPGIGPYTAGAMISIAFDRPRAILDGNVIRVLTRYHAVMENAKEAGTQAHLWDLARAWVEAADALRPRPMQACSHLNQAIMELGACICLPGDTAHCHACPLQQGCRARRSSMVSELPKLPKRRAMIRQYRNTYVLFHAGRVLLRRKETQEVNAGLWEFYSEEASSPHEGGPCISPSCRKLRLNGIRSFGMKPLATIKHTITHHRITLSCFWGHAEGPGKGLDETLAWVGTNSIETLPMPSAHQKIRRHVLDLEKSDVQGHPI